jgi:hypothetical protein
LVVAGEDLPVGPFGLEGALEALYPAVLSGAVGLDELLADPVRSADAAQSSGMPRRCRSSAVRCG